MAGTPGKSDKLKVFKSHTAAKSRSRSRSRSRSLSPNSSPTSYYYNLHSINTSNGTQLSLSPPSIGSIVDTQTVNRTVGRNTRTTFDNLDSSVNSVRDNDTINSIIDTPESINSTLLPATHQITRNYASRFIEKFDTESSNSQKQNNRLFRKSSNSQPLNRKLIKSKRDELEAKVGPWSDSSSHVIWTCYCKFITFAIKPIILRWFGIKSRQQQMAWREKIGLFSIIIFITCVVGFFTFGFNEIICGITGNVPRIHFSSIPPDSVIIHGRLFNMTNFNHSPKFLRPPPWSSAAFSLTGVSSLPIDASLLFQNVNGNCESLIIPSKSSQVGHDSDYKVPWYLPCKLLAVDDNRIIDFYVPTNQPIPDHRKLSFIRKYSPDACHTSKYAREKLYEMKSVSDVYYTWEDIEASPRNIAVLFNDVLDLDRLKLLPPEDWELSKTLSQFASLNSTEGLPVTDISKFFVSDPSLSKTAKCLIEITKVGFIDVERVGCLSSHVVLYTSLLFIFSIVLVKFTFALYFEWFVSWRMGANGFSTSSWLFRLLLSLVSSYQRGRQNIFDTRNMSTDSVSYVSNMSNASNAEGESSSSIPAASSSSTESSQVDLCKSDISLCQVQKPISPTISSCESIADQMYVICLVTVYSESEDGLRLSLDSLASTDYPDCRKLLVVICDGLVTGANNDRMTSEIALSLMEDISVPFHDVPDLSYISVGYGKKRINLAQVHCGYYVHHHLDPTKKTRRVPIICIVKCGLVEERENSSKPGNRGKRDSQLILMGFFQKLCMGDRKTALENELHYSMEHVFGIDPHLFEAILMVDADTKVYEDSLGHMVATLVNDTNVIGLCGETKIANKWDSWVTMIQVFEYFISHHLTKSFESVFGGVTCLPGCFSMYRIKAPPNSGHVLLLLASPAIVSRYSDNIVNTVHRKNLLLLGEDRYLTTLMLKSFPIHKLIFVPQAKCKTIVPSKFKALLDQRRRWINSTIHNLLELLLVRELCGVFCFSMQFVVLIDLIGTVTLPAALSFTIYLLAACIYRQPPPVVPLILLALILGIPGVLIVVTAHQWIYVLWMLIYLCSLPVWNLILPLNACKYGNDRVAQEQS